MKRLYVIAMVGFVLAWIGATAALIQAIDSQYRTSSLGSAWTPSSLTPRR